MPHIRISSYFCRDKYFALSKLGQNIPLRVFGDGVKSVCLNTGNIHLSVSFERYYITRVCTHACTSASLKIIRHYARRLKFHAIRAIKRNLSLRTSRGRHCGYFHMFIYMSKSGAGRRSDSSPVAVAEQYQRIACCTRVKRVGRNF